MTNRQRRILHEIDIAHQKGLEVGPLTSPIVTKQLGDIYYLDHLSTKLLKAKYKDDVIDEEEIVEVDYVLKNSLSSTLKGQKFDYVVASHVIEHIPDFTKWLQEIAGVLKDGGVLSLVIPDKRFTFDIQRTETSFPEVMGAYIDRLKRPSSATLYDFYSKYIDGVDTAKVWEDPDAYQKSKGRWSQEEARKLCEDHKHTVYVDCHCSVFTPQSFVDILRQLIKNNLFDYKVSYFLKTQPYELEFYVSLTKLAHKDTKIQLASLPRLKNDKLESEQSLKEKYDIMQQEIEALKQSTSWKITQPLRTLKQQQGRVKKKLAIYPKN